MASYARTARRQSGVDIWSNAGPNNLGKVGSVDKFDFTSPSVILKQLVNKASHLHVYMERCGLLSGRR